MYKKRGVCTCIQHKFDCKCVHLTPQVNKGNVLTFLLKKLAAHL